MHETVQTALLHSHNTITEALQTAQVCAKNIHLGNSVRLSVKRALKFEGGRPALHDVEPDALHRLLKTTVTIAFTT